MRTLVEGKKYNVFQIFFTCDVRGCPNRVKVKQSYCLREITKKTLQFFLVFMWISVTIIDILSEYISISDNT